MGALTYTDTQKMHHLTFLGHEVTRLENGDYDFVRAVQSQIDSVTAGFILCGNPQRPMVY